METEQRDLRFRVWHKRFRYFLRPDQLQSSIVDVVSHEDSFSLDDREVIFQQWTGLVDAESRKIFEGDILSMDLQFRDWEGAPLYYKNIIAVISFGSGAFWFTGGGFTNCTWFHYEAKDRRVIGNIFENPELMK